MILTSATTGAAGGAADESTAAVEAQKRKAVELQARKMASLLRESVSAMRKDIGRMRSQVSSCAPRVCFIPASPCQCLTFPQPSPGASSSSLTPQAESKKEAEQAELTKFGSSMTIAAEHHQRCTDATNQPLAVMGGAWVVAVLLLLPLLR